jgi:exportin-T
MIKSARTFNEARHQRDGRVRDAVRERDAPSINAAVIAIVTASAERMRGLRTSGADSREIVIAEEVVDWGIRTFGSYVGTRSRSFSV